jgi:hypothetical protein
MAKKERESVPLRVMLERRVLFARDLYLQSRHTQRALKRVDIRQMAGRSQSMVSAANVAHTTRRLVLLC